jgi:hypothetical protein
MFKFDITSFIFKILASFLLSQSASALSSLVQGRVEPDFAVRLTIDITVKESGEGQYRTMMKKKFEYTFLSERSLQVNQFNVQESPVGTVSGLEATFNKRELSDKRFSYEIGSSDDVFVSGTKRHTITIPVNISKGDVFVYSYKEELRDIAFFPLLYVSSRDSITSYSVTYHLPEHAEIDFHTFFSGDSIPIQIERDERTVTLNAGPLSERTDIPFYPFDGNHAVILPSIRSDTADVTLSSLRRLVQWYSQKTALVPQVDSADVQSARMLIDTAGTTADRVRSIADYIRKNIRYIADERGLNAYIPRAPSSTLKKKYGDCKDKAALGVSLGRLNKVPVYMALVSTEPVPEFEQPHMHLYDHVICAYVIDGKTAFFDPTAANVEFGNIPDRLIGARALVLDPDNPRYVRIPSPQRDPSLDITISTHIDSLSRGKAVIVLRNGFAAAARYAFRELTRERWRQYLQELIASNLFQIRLNDFRFDSEDEHSMTILASAEASAFAVASPPRTYIPQAPFIGQFTAISERAKDSLPLYFVSEDRLRLQLNITAPGRTADTSHPVSMGPDGGPWRYSASLSQKGDQIVVRYEYRSVQKNIPLNERSSFLPFIKQYIAGKKNRFIILQNP